MSAKRPILLFLALAALFAATAAGNSDAQMVLPEDAMASQPRRVCLNKDQQRAAISEGKAIPLAQAMHAVGRRPREVVKARLCHDTNGLVYMLTLLARDGKVTRATVDATNGRVISGR
jgi:uncharacterized membrane protein YkoI